MERSMAARRAAGESAAVGESRNSRGSSSIADDAGCGGASEDDGPAAAASNWAWEVEPGPVRRWTSAMKSPGLVWMTLGEAS